MNALSEFRPRLPSCLRRSVSTNSGRGETSAWGTSIGSLASWLPLWMGTADLHHKKIGESQRHPPHCNSKCDSSRFLFGWCLKARSARKWAAERSGHKSPRTPSSFCGWERKHGPDLWHKLQIHPRIRNSLHLSSIKGFRGYKDPDPGSSVVSSSAPVRDPGWKCPVQPLIPCPARQFGQLCHRQIAPSKDVRSSAMAMHIHLLLPDNADILLRPPGSLSVEPTKPGPLFGRGCVQGQGPCMSNGRHPVETLSWMVDSAAHGVAKQQS